MPPRTFRTASSCPIPGGDDSPRASRHRHGVFGAEIASKVSNKSRFSVRHIFERTAGAKQGSIRTYKKRATLPANFEEANPEDQMIARIREMSQRTVVSRAIYSSARKTLQSRSMDVDEEPAGEDSPEHPKTPRLTLKAAGKALQDAARQTIVRRNWVASFMTHVKTEAEEDNLENEMMNIERRREHEEKVWKTNGLLTVNHFQAHANFLLSLLDELKKFRTSDSDQTAMLVDDMMADMRQLMIKMNALKSMYQMDRRHCLSLNNAIEQCVAEVQKRFARIGDTMKQLSACVQGLGENVAEQMREQGENMQLAVGDQALSNLSGELPDPSLRCSRPGDKRRDPHDRQIHRFQEVEQRLQMEGSFPEEILKYWDEGCELIEESSETLEKEGDGRSGQEVPIVKPSKAGLWRKAAIIMSFEKCLFGGTMNALKGAVQDVCRAAEEAGHKPLALPGLNDSPGTSMGSTERPASYQRAVKHWQAALSGCKAMEKKEQAVAFVNQEDDSKPSTSDTGLPSSSLSCTSPPTSAGTVERHPRRPPGTALWPQEYPAIGADPIILPTSVQQLVFGRQTPEMTLEPRLKAPFVMLPLVPTRQLPPLKETARIRKWPVRKDGGCSTVEAVLAERQRRGIRGGDAFVGDEFSWQFELF